MSTLGQLSDSATLLIAGIIVGFLIGVYVVAYLYKNK